jgi:hypothetical protein
MAYTLNDCAEVGFNAAATVQLAPSGG